MACGKRNRLHSYRAVSLSDKSEVQDSLGASLEAALWDYLEKFNAGDVEGVCAYFAEDCLNVPPLGPELRGLEAVRNYYTLTFQQANPRIFDYRFEYDIHGNRAVVQERWVVRLRDAEGNQPMSRGRSLWAGFLEAGQWKVERILARLEPA